MKKIISIFIIVCFAVTGQVGTFPIYAQEFRLPAPGVMVHLSPEFDPPLLKGIKVHPNDPFRFDFILDKGDSQLGSAQLKDESSKLIKYFLTSITIPEKDLWVNLSPYEKDRIIPQSFGLTEMGRDLLAEDYMLKQITASLIYPDDEIGKKFWKRVYEEAEKKFGTTNIPVNTFNKVWIVPEKAVVYENTKAGTAYVVESKLKVMLEQDYLSLEKHAGIQSKLAQVKDTNQLGSQIVREIVIPELTKEVNENKNFAQLRQVYSSLILATWYKKKIKNSILSEVYSNKNKVAGVRNDDPKEKEKIYQRYLQAFKKGVYNYIKDEIDPLTQETTPRKYFSGGVDVNLNKAMVVEKKFNTRTFLKGIGAGLLLVSGGFAAYELSSGRKADQAVEPPKKLVLSPDPVTGIKQIFDDFKLHYQVDDYGAADLQTLGAANLQTADGKINLDCIGAAQVLVNRFRADERMGYPIKAHPIEVIESNAGVALLHVATLVEITKGPYAGYAIMVDPHELMTKVGVSKPFNFREVYTSKDQIYWQIKGQRGDPQLRDDLHHRIRLLNDNGLPAYVQYFNAVKLEDLTKRQNMLLEASKLDPINPHIWKMIAGTQMLGKYWSNSRQYYYKALEHNPHLISALLYLWVLDMNEGKLKDALTHINQLIAEIELELPQDLKHIDISESKSNISALAELYVQRDLLYDRLGRTGKRDGKMKREELLQRLGSSLEKSYNDQGEPANDVEDEVNDIAHEYQTILKGTLNSYRSSDKASLTNGGIDLSFANNVLHIQNTGDGIEFHVNPAMLAQFQNAPGFVPVINNIQPMTDLRQFLGD